MSSNYSSLFPTMNGKYTVTRGPGVSSGHDKQIDTYVPKGTILATPVSGQVVYAQYHTPSDPKYNSFGNEVIIKSNGKYYHFAHLDGINVEQGVFIKAGTVIGKIGNTGDVKPAPGRDGTHLHFEIRGGKMSGEKFNVDSEMDAILAKANASTSVPLTDTEKLQKMLNSLGPQEPSPEHTDIPNSPYNIGGDELKQTTTFLNELSTQLPSILPTIIARLAMGEDIKVISADMATRLIATSAINTYAENHWAASGGRGSLQANTADAIAQYATTIIITNVFSGGMSKEEYVRAAANISIQTITTELIKYTEVTAAQQLATQAAYNKAISYGASESAAKLAGSEAASAIKTVPLSPRASGTAAAIAYIGMKIAEDGLPKNQEEVEDMIASAASAYTCAMVGMQMGTAFGPLGMAAGFVIGLVAGQALTNAFNSGIDNTKEAIDGTWDAGGKILRGDIWHGVGDLVKTEVMALVHSVQVVGHFIADVGDTIKLLTFGNEAPPPPPLFKIEQKSDGTGQIVYSLHDGRTIVVGNGNDDIVGTNAGETLAGGDGNNTLYALGGDDFLDGRGGNDVLIAGDGNDNVSSGAGDDFIDGGSGNDTIQGQAGNDTIAGGAGGRHHLR